jgi:hypothetical protein
MSEPPLQRPVKVFLLDILFRVEEYLRHKSPVSFHCDQ